MDTYPLPSGAPACAACGLRVDDCVCALLPRLELGLELHLVLHVGELNRQSNTGRLAHRICAGSRLHVYGREGAPIDWSPLTGEGPTPWLLWPGPEAKIADPTVLAEGAAVVVLDGSWRQTRRMQRRNPELSALRPLALPPGPPPRWRARRSPGADRYCTLEAVILLTEALGLGDRTPPLWAALGEVERRLLRQRGHAPGAGRDRT